MIEYDIVETDNYTFYSKKGKNCYWHRKDGPAYFAESYIGYYTNSLRTRLDGPSVIFIGFKSVEYWIDELYYSEKDFFKKIAK